VLKKINSGFKKALAINKVKFINTIQIRIQHTIDTNEEDHESLTKTLN
jgi:hypothetical protein